jgi:hypothetical protein
MSRTKPLWLATTAERLRRLLAEDIDEDEQKRRFYQALLHIAWLPSKVRGAILRELGSSLRQEQGRYAKGHAQVLRHLIKEEEMRIRESGERPRGGVHNAAVEEVAKRFKLDPNSMERQLRRKK